jgi:hypothetical protein
MSDRELGKFIKDKWPELLVFVGLLGLGKVVWDFNREIGAYAADSRNVNTSIERIDATLIRLEGRMDGLNKLSTDVAVMSNKVDTVQRDIADIRSSKSGSSCAGCSASKTISQCGEFSRKTLMAGKTNVFRWKLSKPANPAQVANIGAQFNEPIPGVVINPKLIEGGKACEMEIVGNIPPALADRLIEGIAGCVTIVVMPNDDDQGKEEGQRAAPTDRQKAPSAPAAPKEA